MATTLSLVVIFVPVSFMSSVSGRFLYQFGITAAAAVLVSLLVSFTLTPMMSARLLRPARQRAGGGAGEGATSRSGFYGRIEAGYDGMLRWSMGHRAWVAALAVLVMASSVPLYRVVRQEYVPSNTDEGEFEVNINAPEGASLKAMNGVTYEVERELLAVPGVRSVLASAGGGGFLGSVNNARLYVRLAPHSERTFRWSRLLQWPPWDAFRGNYSQRDVVQEIRRRLKAFPDLRLSIRNQQTINLGGPNYDIDFALLGPDLESLARYADTLRRKAPELGLLDADTTLRLNKPELRVEIDRARAARLGVDTEDIAEALRLMVGGDQRVSRFRDESVNEDYDVQLRLSEVDRQDAVSIGRLSVPGAGGGLIRLDNLVSILPSKTVSRIDRLDRQRQVRLRTAIAPGYAQADRIAALREEVERMNLPAAYSTRVSGKARELETTFNEFLWAFALSVILMYIILASQFESLVHPLTILLSLPLSVPFALLSLWLGGQTINLYSALGMLVLFGVVKKNAILQIDHMNHLREQGMDRLAAILQANRDRLRPILMTTLTLVAGMIPLAVGSGPGAEERRATALVVIGGQSLCLLLTLVVTPVAYSILDDFGRLFRLKRALAAEDDRTGAERATEAGATAK
jgi:HAE1 family hydrophobic/amphiphilic exporter-1